MLGRGKVVEEIIAKSITFNEEVFSKAYVEIDHINYGLNLKTKELSLLRRSDFSPADVCQFLLELDGMDLDPGKVTDEFNYFALELLCPVKGQHFGKKFSWSHHSV